ncbi:MAG: tetratricopeptide repeat protein [Pirellulaceae bacterium]|nr:tetratricopeptide repeat protein [Pirellulaceae bacterium]
MRRILLAALFVLATLAICPRAEARWGHHCGWGGGWRGGYCGWGGGWGGGWRNCGWGGGWNNCGWGGGWNNCGWGGVSVCYRPVCRPVFSCGYPTYFYSGPIGFQGCSTYNTYYNPQANFVAYSLPTTVQPAELAYGPQAVKQFLGLNRNFALTNLNRPATPIVITLKTPDGPRVTTISPRSDAKATDIKAAARVVSLEQRRRAEQYIALGDSLFREQKFHSALQKYKLAAQTAPDMAEAFWREGHAMIATGNFELASGAFKRAIALDPDTSREGFRLDNLYGPSRMAKEAHIEALAGWALERTGSSNPYFLMGVTLAYDGQPDRAAKFFGRAAELAGIAGGHIAAFEVAPPPVLAERRAPTVPVSAAAIEL